MLENELVELVTSVCQKKCESNYIEVKSAKKDCPKLYDTFSSFSNQPGGGVILFGIAEKEDYQICGVYDAADLLKKIMELSLQMEPEIRPLCTTAVIDGKTVVSAEIQEIDNEYKPCFYKGAGRLKGSYIRVAEADRHMTEYEVYSFEAFKKKLQDELRIAERAEIEDINTKEFSRYLLEARSQKPKLAELTVERICHLQGFTAQGRPTLAGVMLFSDYPQGFFPQLCITAVSIPGTQMSITGDVGERFLDNRRIDGTLPQMLEDALLFVRKNMKEKTIIDPKTGKRIDKPEYPVIAVRELILNALVHRDYSIHTDNTPITIRMFRDRLEIENPGGLYGRMTLDQLGKVSADTRNPFLANALEILGETENRYSGIPTVFSAMEEAGLPAPKFENERGIFRVTLYKAELGSLLSLEPEEHELLHFCKVPRSRAEIETLFANRMTLAYVMQKFVRPMVEKGMLQMTMPEKPKSKHQRYVTNQEFV